MMRIYPAVKNLIFINISIFLIQNIHLLSQDNSPFTSIFALSYGQVMQNGAIWSLLTYAFLHGGFLHLFFNMLILFFIANEIEAVWGSKKFLQFYLLTSVGAGAVILATSALRIFAFNDFSAANEYTVGASGAIFALLLAYSFLFPERNITLLLFFIIPVNIRGKYLVWISLLFTFIFNPLNSSISHSGHIGGILSGFLFLVIFGRQQPYYLAYNQMMLFFRETFSVFQPNKIRKIKNSKKNNFFNVKYNESSRYLDENNMSEREIEEQIDYLLDKISEKGLRGLSAQEKDFLNRISVLYHHKFP